MSRSKTEISESLQNRIALKDPRVDTSKGWVNSVVINPVSGELAEVEADVEHTRLLYSTKFFDEATDEEIELWAANLGIGLGVEVVALTTLTFWRYSPPSSDIVIPSGIVVGTADSSVRFYTSETKTMYFSASSSYYNANKRRYEINVQASALGPGSDYEVGAYALTLMLSDLGGIDGVENQVSTAIPVNSRGLRTRTVLENRIKDKLMGTRTGLGGSIIVNIVQTDEENVRRVNLVFSSDRENYFGDGRRAAVDAYVDSTRVLTSRTEVISGVAGQSNYYLTTAPVKAITKVLVNGVQITDFSLVVDTETATRYSTNAQDRLSFGSTVVINNGDEIEVDYAYNSLLKELSETYPYEGLFATPILYREPIFYGVDVTVLVVPLTANAVNITDDVETAILKYFNREVDFNDVMTASLLEDYIDREVAYASSVKIIKFQPSVNAVADVEAISFPPYGLPTPGTIDVSNR